MVNTGYNGISSVTPINASYEESIARGRFRGWGRGRYRGRGHGRVTPIGDGSPVDTAPMNENPPAHHEVIEDNVYFDDVENVEEIGQDREGTC